MGAFGGLGLLTAKHSASWAGTTPGNSVASARSHRRPPLLGDQHPGQGLDVGVVQPVQGGEGPHNFGALHEKQLGQLPELLPGIAVISHDAPVAATTTSCHGRQGVSPMSDPIRLFLVDDQELVRGLRDDARRHPRHAGRGPGGDGRAALDALTGPGAVPTDVVLMDIQMSRLNGVEATKRSLQQGDPPKVLVLTTFDLDEFAFAALPAGASGLLLKDVGPTDLLAAIRAVHAGDSVVAPSTTRRLIDAFVTPVAGPPGSGPAMDAEQAQARAPHRARARGPRGRRPGPDQPRDRRGLFVAEATVKTHIGAVLRKLGLRDRLQMVVLAYETGLVAVGDG